MIGEVAPVPEVEAEEPVHLDQRKMLDDCSALFFVDVDKGSPGHCGGPIDVEGLKDSVSSKAVIEKEVGVGNQRDYALQVRIPGRRGVPLHGAAVGSPGHADATRRPVRGSAPRESVVSVLGLMYVRVPFAERVEFATAILSHIGIA